MLQETLPPARPDQERSQREFAGQIAMEYLNETVPILKDMVKNGLGKSLAKGEMLPSRIEDDVFIDIDVVGEGILHNIVTQYPSKKISVFGESSQNVNEGADYIVVADTFDNTKQFKAGLDTTPYTALSIYDREKRPLAAGIANLHNGMSTLAIDGKVYEFDFSAEQGIQPPKLVVPSERRALNNKKLVVATYLGSNKYSLPAMDLFGNVYKNMHKQGILYAGGGAFVYGPIAQGLIDAYFMPGEPNSETAAGAAMLQIAGGIVVVVEKDMSVRHWEFEPERFGGTENILIAAGNTHIADKIIGRIDKTAQGNFRDLIAA